MIIKLQQRAVAVDAADPENAEVEAELRDKIEGRFADNPAVAAAQFAAREDDAEVVFLHQGIGHVQVVRDHAQVLVIQQRMGDRFRRGADINKQRRPVRDLAGDLAGNALFLCRLRGFTVMPGGIDRTGRQRRPAVVAKNAVLIGQVVQVTTDGLWADGKLLHQLFGADVSLFFYQFDNSVMTLCLFHQLSLRIMFVFAHGACRQRPSPAPRPARRRVHRWR